MLRALPGASFEDLSRELSFPQTTSGLFYRDVLAGILDRLMDVGVVERVGAPAQTTSETAWDRPRAGGAESRPGYQVTPALLKLQQALGLSLHLLENAANTPHADEVDALSELAATLEERLPPCGYKTDLVHSVREVSRCLESKCYLAVMALAGKLLETAIKHHLEVSGEEFEDGWMLGQLIGKLEKSRSNVDRPMKEIATIINASRIPAVHAKRDIPLPSANQASMVVRGTLHAIKQLVVPPGANP